MAEIADLKKEISQISALRDRLDQLEKQLAQTAALKEVVESESVYSDHPTWTDSLSIGGVLEAEGFSLSPFEGERESDAVLATMSLSIEAEINPSTVATVTLLYEEDEGGLDVDEAFLSHARGDSVYTFGQIFVPFGTFATSMISNPLTLELAEIRESAFLYQRAAGAALFHAYVFNGESDVDGDEAIANWGLGADFGFERDSYLGSVSIDYLSNITDSDMLQDFGFGLTKPIDALSVSVQVSRDIYAFSIEYIDTFERFPSALADFNGRDAAPTVYHVELSRAFAWGGRSAVFSFSYQNTEELLFAEFPEQRISAAIAAEIASGVALSMEVFRDRDYADTETGLGVTGTGNHASGVIVQLATEF